jgi:hypothetical protein
VDIDIETRSGLNKLLNALKPTIIVLHKNKQGASIELANVQPQTVEEAVLHIYKIVQLLPPSVRALWDKCERRVMNIGIQAGSRPYEKIFSISSKTVKLIVAMRAEIAFTVYACRSKKS